MERPNTGLQELSEEQLFDMFSHHLKEMSNAACELQYRQHRELVLTRLVGMIMLYVVDVTKAAMGVHGTAARIDPEKPNEQNTQR